MGGGGLHRVSALIMWVLLLTSVLTLGIHIRRACGTSIIVPGDYQTIQEAISAAALGDTVYVKSGNYYENLILDKPLSLVGENVETTTIHGNETADIVTINAANVLVTDFTIENAKQDGRNGVGLYDAVDCIVSGNNFENNWMGIIISGGSNINITGNRMEGNEYGVAGDGCSGCIIAENVVKNNWDGIGIDESSDVNVVGNSVSNNQDGGFVSDFPVGNYSIVGNSFWSNTYGIWINGEISKNVSGNSISNNNITSNSYGILLHNDLSEKITKNDIANNTEGIHFDVSSNNSVYHNNFRNNTNQVYDDNSSNLWNDYYPSGGNYWSDYSGVDIKSGPNQDQPGSDGIGDTPRAIDSYNKDEYPLVYAYGSPPPPSQKLSITATDGGTTDPPPGTYTYTLGQNVSVRITSNQGYSFSHWELDGLDIGAPNPVIVPIDSDHSLRAVFVEETYDVTISAYCNIEGVNVSVDILKDNSETGFTTPCTFTGLTGYHNFTVPPSDGSGHPFKQWSSSENSTTITVNTSGTYTATYDAEYLLTITSNGGGTTSPPPATYGYWSGSSVDVLAIPDRGYYLDYWQLDGANISGLYSAMVEMDTNHTLQPVFKQLTQGDDVAVKYISNPKTVVFQGYSVIFNVTVMNVGIYAETFNVTLYVNSSSYFLQPVGLQSVTLESSDSATITLSWNTTGIAKGNYTISAYAWPVLGETDTANNNFTGGSVYVSMIGDLTGTTPFVPDGKCDGRDITVVAKCFGSSMGDPNYNPNCDILNRGKIDGRDITIVAKHFGEHDP